jgi:outer membrane protein
MQEISVKMKDALISIAFLVLLNACPGHAQVKNDGTRQTSVQTLPSAPMPPPSAGQTNQPIQGAPAAMPQYPPSQPAHDTVGATSLSSSSSLSVKQAEALALKNNPLISVAQLTALASQQVTREVRSSLWPTATGNLTGVDSQANSRITAGGLNNPIIYERAAAGVTVSQLITDFGRTRNLVSSADYAAKAENQNAVATKEQILLAVDQAFYGALQAQAVMVVAQQTVGARQNVADQVGALFKSKLKSQLDFSFASVNLAQAQLLVLDAENNENAALATLSMILGYQGTQKFQLVEDATVINPPSSNVDDLIAQALSARPEILSLQFQEQAAQKFQHAEHDLFLPNISAVGVAGDTPVRNPILSNWYGAVGVNVQIPLFNGFLYSARSREAALKAQAAHDRVLDLRNRISRDVRTGWLNANTAYARLSVTQQLLDQSNIALDLAQTRYNMGLSSIVELSQAQLQQTQAQISNAQAAYDFRLASAMLRYETTGI